MLARQTERDSRPGKQPLQVQVLPPLGVVPAAPLVDLHLVMPSTETQPAHGLAHTIHRRHPRLAYGGYRGVDIADVVDRPETLVGDDVEEHVT